jgi:hypothetical protein
VNITIPANEMLLDWLTEQLERPPRRFRTRRHVSTDALRCHPDLCDRLHLLAKSLPGTEAGYVAGLPVLTHPNAVVFGIAGGTSWLALRLPRHAHGAVFRSEWGARGLGGEWIDIDPWMTDVEAYEGVRRLRGWSRAAFDHAAELVRPTRPSRRRGAPR